MLKNKHEHEHDPPDVDSITSFERDKTFQESSGRRTEVTQDTPESRFFNKNVHDTTASIVSIVLVLGLVTTGLLAATLQIPGADRIIVTCALVAGAVTLAILVWQPFRKNISIHVEELD